MGRVIGGVVAGYLAMAAVVFVGLTAAYVAMGADRAFLPGSYDVSVMWILTSLVVGFAAALLGGKVARAIARRATGPRALAAVVVVLGLVLAFAAMGGSQEAAGLRAGAVNALDAMQRAQTPLWVMLVNPVIGALGVLVGGGGVRAVS